VNRALILALGIAATLGVTALWHGPLGHAEKFASFVEGNARAQLDHDEMTQVQAHLERDPLTRRLILSGPADYFQRGEIVRRMELLPGIGQAVWDPASLPAEERR
jgi:hypothetical protein